jgi:hypothetical protein
MSFLEELMEKVNQVTLNDGEFVAKQKIRRGEVVVGILPEPLRKLYVVYVNSIIELTEISNALEREEFSGSNITQKQIGEINLKQETANRKHALVEYIFLSSMILEMPELADKSSFGVREGWQVVFQNDRCQSCDARGSCFLRRFGCETGGITSLLKMILRN